ncbi:MAG: glutaredoxin family protein [bacterium]
MLKKSRKKIRIDVYSKADCSLCDKAKQVLLEIRDDFNVEIHEIDITKDSSLYEEFKESIPVVFINGRKAFKYNIDGEDLRKKLRRLI